MDGNLDQPSLSSGIASDDRGVFKNSNDLGHIRASAFSTRHPTKSIRAPRGISGAPKISGGDAFGGAKIMAPKISGPPRKRGF